MKHLVNSFMISLLLMLMASCSFFGGSEKIDLDHYQPNKDYTPAFRALSAYADKADSTYDIEKTVRAMNSIELAQSQSADFMSFLEVLAKEDYTGVAPDVLKAKIRLLPILQRMSELKAQNEQLDDIWVLAQCAASGVENVAKNEEGKSLAASAAAFSLTAFDPLQVLTIVNGTSKVSCEMFSEYRKSRSLKGKLANELESLRLAYIDYLTEYAPVYHKYMKEFDALCLKKDKAYLDIYDYRNEDAYNVTKEILKQYPDNREGLLLNAISLINIALKNDSNRVLNLPTEKDFKMAALNDSNPKIMQANDDLDKYILLYPGKSAPALVVRAMAFFATGKEAQAISCLDQAAIEYPKQAAELTDLLNSYKCRTYLNKTPEGLYLLRLYYSTMEGYGMFSPNFQKAAYYEAKGDLAKSSSEIYSHFFRRGNQNIYDNLLSDMEYCETHLNNSFKKLLIEHSFIDLNIEPANNWLGMDKDDEIEVEVTNRSDLNLENVRLYLCIHYTDMYKDEYDVVKSSSVNVIKPHESVDFADMKLDYQNKKYSDITRIRAIAMTDNKICWIDQPDYKIKHAAEESTNANQKEALMMRRAGLKRNYMLDEDKVKTLLSGLVVPTEKPKNWWGNIWSSNKIHVQAPRVLALLDPVFSIRELQNDGKTPSSNVLGGSNILMEFDEEPKPGVVYPLYMYSDYFDCKLDIKYDKNGKATVSGVKIL